MSYHIMYICIIFLPYLKNKYFTVTNIYFYKFGSPLVFAYHNNGIGFCLLTRLRKPNKIFIYLKKTMKYLLMPMYGFLSTTKNNNEKKKQQKKTVVIDYTTKNSSLNKWEQKYSGHQ